MTNINPKFQVPNYNIKSQYTNSKYQFNWSLIVGVWSLLFADWSVTTDATYNFRFSRK